MALLLLGEQAPAARLGRWSWTAQSTEAACACAPGGRARLGARLVLRGVERGAGCAAHVLVAVVDVQVRQALQERVAVGDDTLTEARRLPARRARGRLSAWWCPRYRNATAVQNGTAFWIHRAVESNPHTVQGKRKDGCYVLHPATMHIEQKLTAQLSGEHHSCQDASHTTPRDTRTRDPQTRHGRPGRAARQWVPGTWRVIMRRTPTTPEYRPRSGLRRTSWKCRHASSSASRPWPSCAGPDARVSAPLAAAARGGSWGGLAPAAPRRAARRRA